jgi:hypothetical protein
MAFFKEAPAKALSRDRDTAQANLSRLKTKLHDAAQAVIATKSAAQRAALDGDDGGLDAAEAAERVALHRHGTLSAAYAEAGKLLAVLEEQIATMTDQKLRTATAAEVNVLGDELAQAGAAYDASTRALNEVATRALAVSFELNGLVVFTASSVIEVAAAIPVVTEVLRQHSRAVLNRLAPAEMPVPAPPAAKVVPAAKEALTRVFATRAVRWRDATGSERCSGKFLDIDVSAAQAERALASGAALPLDHPERKRNLGSWPGQVSINNCYNLDTAPAAPRQHDPVVHSAFTPVDRGPAFKLRVATS